MLAISRYLWKNTSTYDVQTENMAEIGTGFPVL